MMFHKPLTLETAPYNPETDEYEAPRTFQFYVSGETWLEFEERMLELDGFIDNLAEKYHCTLDANFGDDEAWGFTSDVPFEEGKQLLGELRAKIVSDKFGCGLVHEQTLAP